MRDKALSASLRCHTVSATDRPMAPVAETELGRQEAEAACAREPIHIPGSIQAHGHLLAFDTAGLTLTHASADAGLVIGQDVTDAFGLPAARLLPGPMAALLRDRLPASAPGVPVGLGTLPMTDGAVVEAIGHRSTCGHLIVEFELPGAADEMVTQDRGVRDAFARLGRAASTTELSATAAAALRAISGFDRVLIYRFEENWDGVVVGEDGNGRLPSYLGLRFPATDIPAQARRLYEANPLRLIADEAAPAVPIRAGRQGPPLDLSFSALRSVSPVHLDYMRNMGTASSMSVSILRGDGRLWGLACCHHAGPRRVPPATREDCDLVARMFAARVVASEEMEHAQARGRLKGLEGRLIARMTASERMDDGLVAVPTDLLEMAGATGAAVLAGGECKLVGRTPAEGDVRRIADWLAQQDSRDVVETECLSASMPGAEAMAETASGILAISISNLHPNFVIWFRPEVVSTVTWGGQPAKTVDADTGRLGPRRSFAIWAEAVRLRSARWTPAEIDTARDLRGGIISIVLRAAEERAELTGRLERVNRELAAFSYTVSHDLRAPFRHITGFAALLKEQEGAALSERGRRYVGTIAEAAETAGRLVDALLNFSQMGRSSMVPVQFDPAMLVAEVQRALETEIAGRPIDWRIAPMPAMQADPVMMRQVFQNLLSNAVKYTRGRDPAVIEVSARIEGGEFVCTVRDNGVGFDMAYVHKLFGVFQRLHRAEEFEGVGIGLANVQRIVERHGGRIWAEGALGQGAAFHFALPMRGIPAGKAG